MRTIVGAIGVLGLAVTVAAAQPPRERGATFRPPEALPPGEPSVVARGAADEFPPSSFLPGTPVVKPKAGVAGPAWLTGADANVVPAAGTVSKSSGVRTLTPPAKEEAGPLGKSFERLKSAAPTPPRPQAQPPAPAPPPQPTAESPYRGTSASGAPVFAGPPAYRWYGWGTVTPGANQFAPTGQYPRASANWYAITGATPGAFPVPVANPFRTPPGTDPPNYGTARVAVAPQPPVVPVATQPQPQPQFQPPVQPRPQPAPVEPPKFIPPPETKAAPGVGLAPMPPVTVPKLTSPPTTIPVAVAPPAVPAPIAAKEPAPLLIPPPAMPEPVAVVPPSVVPSVLPSVEPAKPVAVNVPSPLPISVTAEPKRDEAPKQVEAPKREQLDWQPTTEPPEPRPGTWAPAGEPLPVRPVEQPAPLQTSDATVRPIVVRAQMPDANPDPVAALIEQVCQGRAQGVEVRPAGAKKLMVCFEARTAADAKQLVADISRRPELGPYQIDFCVIVK